MVQQIIMGFVNLIFGILVMVFSRQVQKFFFVISFGNAFFDDTKNFKSETLRMSKLNKFFSNKGYERGRKVVFYIFGTLPFLVGAVLIITGILGIVLIK